MEGEHVPMSFFPRFTTLATTSVFWTQPVDLIGFSQIHVSVFRTSVLGGGTTVGQFLFSQSADGIEWEEFATLDPGSDDTDDLDVPIARRFVRVGFQLAGDAPVCTVFCIGWAVRTTP